MKYIAPIIISILFILSMLLITENTKLTTTNKILIDSISNYISNYIPIDSCKADTEYIITTEYVGLTTDTCIHKMKLTMVNGELSILDSEYE